MKKPLLRSITLCSLGFFALSCQEDTDDLVPLPSPDPIYMELPAFTKGIDKSAQESSYEVVMAEYLTADETAEIGQTVLFKERGNQRMRFDFAPENSDDGSSDITYYIDELRPSEDMPPALSYGAVQRAMTTWEEVSCSDLGLRRIPFDRRPTGYMAALFGYGGSTDYVADVVHAGWMPGQFFTRIFGSRGRSIVGVTFTIVHRKPGVPSVDTNGDNRTDVAFREIYYNDRFNFARSIDAESIALHEAGHGLSQDHFGKAFRNKNSGQVHYSPQAVMNPTYSGVQTSITKTDNAGHCNDWANWPNK
ncbi:hypothetical protein [Lewinella sp. IMCC34191]|uniref:hypothetical protein n=1 Tax=Lewinella sp. IMCC34191 TaxID=2259172 RepID=UPI000E21D869|nr:hypothetical protein [Lewinella sp. IMCC34191]